MRIVSLAIKVRWQEIKFRNYEAITIPTMGYSIYSFNDLIFKDYFKW